MLTMQNVLGSVGPQYTTVNDQGSANALNAQGYQVASYTPSGTEGGGTWLMQRMGPNAGDITKTLLGQYIDAYNFGPQQIAGLGATAAQDINEAAARQSASMQQSAMSRGLTNNSAIASLARGVEADRVRSQIALTDSLRRQALDYQFTTLDKIGDLALGLSQLSYTGQPSTPASQALTPTVQPRTANPKVNNFIPGI